MCHMSGVRCQVSGVTCQITCVRGPVSLFSFFLLFLDKVVGLVVGGSVINGASPSSFCVYGILRGHCILCGHGIFTATSVVVMDVVVVVVLFCFC